MPSIGITAAGYVGDFLSLSALNTQYPPNMFAGRQASVTINGVATTYFSDGTSWTAIGSGSSSSIAAKSSTSLIGDSRFAYGLVQQTTGNSGSYSDSPIAWVNDQMRAGGGVGFDVLFNRAVAGKTLQQVIDEQLPAALADSTECLHVMCGINSMTTTGETVANMISKMASLISQAAAAKKLVVIWAISPVGPLASGTSYSRSAEIPLVNGAWRRLCAAYTNVLFVDNYSRMIDPTSNTLEPMPNMMQADDIHQSSEGARMEGLSLLDLLNPSKVTLTKYKTVGTNLLPGWTGTGGTRAGAANSIGVIAGTGTPPAGWDVSRILGGSSVADVTVSTLGPDHIRFVCAPKNVANVIYQISLTSAQQSTLLALLASGDTIQGGFGFQCSSNQALTGVTGQLVIDSNNYYVMGQSPNESGVQYPQVSHSGFRSTEPYVIGATPSAVDFRILIRVGGSVSTDTTTVDIWLPTLSKLT